MKRINIDDIKKDAKDLLDKTKNSIFGPEKEAQGDVVYVGKYIPGLYGPEDRRVVTKSSALMFKKNVKSRSAIDTLYLTVVENIDFSYGSEVSRKPIENYQSMIDNIVYNPLGINIGCIILRKDFNKLKNAMNKKYVVKFSFNKEGENIYDDFIIESVNITEDVAHTTNLKVDIRLMEIKTFKFMDSKFLDKDGSKVKSPSDKSLSNANIGEETKKENTNANLFGKGTGLIPIKAGE